MGNTLCTVPNRTDSLRLQVLQLGRVPDAVHNGDSGGSELEGEHRHDPAVQTDHDAGCVVDLRDREVEPGAGEPGQQLPGDRLGMIMRRLDVLDLPTGSAGQRNADSACPKAS